MFTIFFVIGTYLWWGRKDLPVTFGDRVFLRIFIALDVLLAFAAGAIIAR
jgi:hypothetical protein